MTFSHADFAAQVAANIAYLGGGKLMSWTAPTATTATTFGAVVEDLPADSPFYNRLNSADSSLVSVIAARASFTAGFPQVGHKLVDSTSRSLRIREVIRGQDAASTIQFICGEVAS